MPHQLPIENTLDLHTFAPSDISSVVSEYVTEANYLGFQEVRIIHGRGTGFQRRMVHNVLQNHHLVLEFWDAPESHLGATIARLTLAST